MGVYAGLDVEVVAGEEGLFFEGFADAGSGFGVGSGGESAAEELEGIEVVGTPFEGNGLGWRWGVEPGIDAGGEGGFALFFGLGEAVFEDGRDGAVGWGVDNILNDFSGLGDGDGFGEAVGGAVAVGLGGGAGGCRRGCRTHGGAVNGAPGAVAFEAGVVVGGDLQAVEEFAGAFVVDLVGGEAAEDIVEGEVDGGAVLDGGHFEGFGCGDRDLRLAAVVVMVVAEFFVAHAGGAAAAAEGVEVAADVGGGFVVGSGFCGHGEAPPGVFVKLC